LSCLFSSSDNAAIGYDVDSPRQFTKLFTPPAVPKNFIIKLKFKKQQNKRQLCYKLKENRSQLIFKFCAPYSKENIVGEGLINEDLLS